MRVLVTGAGGQVGRALSACVPQKVELLACSHAELDIGSESMVAAKVQAFRPDAIINAAAYTAVDRAESEVELARRNNADAPRYLATAARQVGARLIHISTDFVFDGRASTPYRPDSPTAPLNVYGATKRDGEQAVLETLPARSLVLRTAWVYGGTGSNFLRTMLRVMGANGAARVVADQVGTPTSTRSLASVLWQLTFQPTLVGVHHWTDAGVASWYDFAVAIAEEASLIGLLPPDVTVAPIATHEYPTPARRPSYSVLDKSSLTALGLQPLHWRKQLRAVLGEMKDA